jgi:hypothetical protein
MGLIIDFIYVLRELIKLSYVVITSPFAVVASLLLVGSHSSI